MVFSYSYLLLPMPPALLIECVLLLIECVLLLVSPTANASCLEPNPHIHRHRHTLFARSLPLSLPPARALNRPLWLTETCGAKEVRPALLRRAGALIECVILLLECVLLLLECVLLFIECVLLRAEQRKNAMRCWGVYVRACS